MFQKLSSRQWHKESSFIHVLKKHSSLLKKHSSFIQESSFFFNLKKQSSFEKSNLLFF